MTVKVVTDSAADLPVQLAQELGITVVPVYVRFGNVKPLLTSRDGELLPTGQAHTRSKSVERLHDFVKNALNIQELAIIHSAIPDETSSLRERIGSIFDKRRIHLARLGPTLGTHFDPGTLILALREKVNSIRQEAGEDEPSKKRLPLPSLHMPKLRFSCP